jgi:hypothetical protein
LSREAAKAEVQLVRIALRRVDGDAGRVVLQKLGQVALALPCQFAPAEGLRAARHLAQFAAAARQRRGADDHHLRNGAGAQVWARRLKQQQAATAANAMRATQSSASDTSDGHRCKPAISLPRKG